MKSVFGAICFILMISYVGLGFECGYDSSGTTCSNIGSLTKSDFIWVTDKGTSSSLTVTVGNCNELEGEDFIGYAFASWNINNLFCDGDPETYPCGDEEDDSCFEDPYADYYIRTIVEVTGSQDAFKKVFPDGIFFRSAWNVSGDSVPVKKTNCQYEFIGGYYYFPLVKISGKPENCADFTSASFGIKVSFYEKRTYYGDDCYKLIKTLSGNLAVKKNSPTEFNPFSFVPSIASGSNNAYIEEIFRIYVNPDAEYYNGEPIYPELDGYSPQTEWKVTHKIWDELIYDCNTVDSWAGPRGRHENTYKIIPEYQEYYRVKIPGFSDDVYGNSGGGLPEYIADRGWRFEFNDTYKYIRLKVNDSPNEYLYFHCLKKSGNKYLVSKINDSSDPNAGSTSWNLSYDANGYITYMFDGSTVETSTKYYEYDWTYDANGSEVDVSYYNEDIDVSNPLRQWHSEWDANDQLTESYNGGCSGCGGSSSNYQKIEYYYTSDYNDTRYEGLVKAIYNSDGDIVQYNEYDPNVSDHDFLTVPLITSRYAIKDYNTANEEKIKIKDWVYDFNESSVIEYTWVDDSNARAVKSYYETNAFGTLLERVEYKNHCDGNLPAGPNYITVFERMFDEDNLDTIKTIYPQKDNDGNDIRIDIEEYFVLDGGNKEYEDYVMHSYTRDESEDINVNDNYYTYNGYGQILTITDPRGATTEYEYYASSAYYLYDHMLKSVIEPNISDGLTDPNRYRKTSYTYTDQRQVETETEYEVIYEYIDFPIFGYGYVDHKIKETVYDYNDTTGFLDSVSVNYDCPDYGDCNYSEITYYIYNDFGEVIRERSPSNVVSGKTYNLAGLLESEFVIDDANDFDLLTNSSLDLVSQTKYYYDSDGRLEYIYRAKDDEVFDYNTPDSWIITKYEYDFLGRKEKEILDYGNTDLTTEYQYNNQGELIKTTEPSGKWSKTITDGRGLTERTVIGYDDSSVEVPVLLTDYYYDDNGNLQLQISPDDTNNLFYYDNFDRLYKKQKVDANSAYTIYDYNSLAGDLVRQMDFDVNDIMLTDSQKEYDTFGRIWRESILAEPNSTDDVNDRITLYEFDVFGNVLKTIYKGIDCNNPDVNEPNDIVLESQYDDLGRIIKKIDGMGNSTSYSYYAGGDVNEITDVNGNSIKYIYDAYGRLEKVVNQEGHYSVKYYNSLNQVYKEIAYDCNTTPASTADDFALEQLRFEYDNIGRLEKRITMKNPASSASESVAVDMVVFYDYNDTTGLLDSEYHYIDGNSTPQITKFEYDAIARKIKTIDPIGNSTTTYYNSSNNAQIVQTRQLQYDPNQTEQYTIITNFTYDNCGRLYTQTIDDYNSTDFNDLVTTFYYDDLGRKERIVAPDTIETTFDYDAFGNLIKRTEDPNSASEPNNLNRITEFGYDRLGRQISITGFDGEDPNGQITTYSYNNNNQVVQIIYPDSNSIEYYYNDLGKVDEEVKRDGESIYYGYDNIGNMLWESNDPDGNEVDANYVSAFEYDGKNRKTYAVKYEDGSFVADSNFFYNGFGLITKEEQTLFNLDTFTVEYDYDQSGNVISASYGNDELEYAHDGINRIKTITKNDTDIVEYTYIGSNTKSVDYIDANVSEYREYDEIGRLSRIYSIKDGESDNILDLQYLYNSSSNRSGVKYNHLTDPVWDKYTYDRLGRLTEVEYASSTAPVACLMTNDRIYLAYQSALEWLNEDVITMDQHRLARIDKEKKNVFGDKVSVIGEIRGLKALGDTPVLALSEMATLDELRELAKAKPADSNESYHQELARQTAAASYVVDSNGTTRQAASISAVPLDGGFGESMMMTAGSYIEDNDTETFDYDLLGNRNQHQTRQEFVETYTSNAYNQYTAIDYDYGFDITRDANLAWDENSSLYNNDLADLTYTYDYRNRLAKLEDSSSTLADYTYDALGRRIRKLIDDDATVYYYDPMGRVLAEYVSVDSNTVALDKDFVYGNGYDEVLGMTVDSNDFYYLHDGLGSIKAVVDSNGVMVEQYAYDVYGNVAAAEGVMFTDDFESGNLNNWTIGGRQQGTNTAEVITYNGSKVAHLYHKDFTEITLEKVFDFNEDLKVSLDIAANVYNARGPTSADYAMAGVGFLFYDSSDQFLGYVQYVKTTSSYPYNTEYTDKELVAMDYSTTMQHYEFSVYDALNSISIDENAIAKVKFRAVTYNSGWGYSNYAHLWLDNIQFSEDILEKTPLPVPEVFEDDFESGNLNNWTIGGRQQGTNTAEVIVLNDSNVAHLYHKDFTEITLEKIFDFDEGLKFSFDIAVSIYNARGPSSADYAKAGVGFFFYDSSDQLLGYTEYVKSTSSYLYGADGGDTLEFIPMNYTTSMQSYEISVREALDKISINESSIDKVKFRAVTYNSGWGYSNYAHLWLDNVEVEVDAYDAKLNSACGNPYLFAGMRFDYESGLYHTLYRNYEPQIGRWIQPDPFDYVDGLNLYEYAGSNPINNIDPYGDDFIAIADRPVKNFEVFNHYSLQIWRCFCEFKPLNFTQGFNERMIQKKCGRSAEKLQSMELLVDTGWKVWGIQHDLAPDPWTTELSKWAIANITVAKIVYSDSSDRIMPVFDGLPSEVNTKWQGMFNKAQNYKWAEQERDIERHNFVNWKRSLYHHFGTNSNTFVRYIAGSLMTEMTGPHPGDYSPKQNTIEGWTLFSSHKPFKGSAPPKPSN